MKKLALLFFAIIAVCSASGQSEPILITVNVPQPWSPYLYDYHGLLNTQIIVLTNTSGGEYDLKLTGNISGDNGLEARTSDSYMPANPIHIGPYQTITLTANSNSLDYLDRSHIEYSGDQNLINNVVQTGILPQGTYDFCLEAHDYTSGQLLSPSAPSGCQSIYIEYVTPPILDQPLCGDTLEFDENPVLQFSWLPVICNIPGSQIVYDLYVVRVLPGQAPVDAIRSAIDYGADNPAVISNLPLGTYTWLPTDPQLDLNTLYVYKVVARDLSGVAQFAQNGESEFCTFYYKKPAETVVTIVNPGVIYNGGTIQYFPSTQISGVLKYEFKTDAGQVTYTLSENSFGTVIPIIGSGNQLSNYTYSSPENYNSQTIGSYTFNPSQSDFMQTQFDPFTASDNDQPPAVLFAHSVPDVKSFPLKNTVIQAYSVYLTAKVPNPTKPSDYAELPEGVVSIDYSSVLNGENISTAYQNSLAAVGPIGAANTSTSGAFSFNLSQDLTYGQLFDSNKQYTFNGSGEVHSSIQGYGLIRAVRLRVISPYYCSPDVMIFPQPGSSTDLGSEICLVNSYKLNVKVLSSDTKNQILGAGDPIPGTRIRIGRLQSDVANIPSEIPGNESHVDQNGQDLPVHTGFFFQPDKFVLYDEQPAGNDGSKTFDRLVRHRISALEYYVEAGTDNLKGIYTYQTYGKIFHSPYSPDPYAFVMDDWTPENGSEIKEKYFHNSDFELKTYNVILHLSPRPSEIYLQTVTKASDQNSVESILPGCEVILKSLHPWNSTVYNTNSSPLKTGDQVSFGDNKIGYTIYKTYQTGPDGTLKIDQLLPDWDATHVINGPYRNVVVKKNGYKQQNLGGSSGKVLQMGERWNIGKVIMEGLGKVKGHVVDENGKPVPALVKIGDGPFMPTQFIFHPGVWGQSNPTFTSDFELNGPSGYTQIEIQPLGTDMYFSHTYKNIYVNYSNGEIQDIGSLIVYKKLHRLEVEVVKPSTYINPNTYQIVQQQVPVENAAVILGNQPTQTTNAEGKVLFLFGSPSTEFRLRVSVGNKFSPVDTYLQIPISESSESKLIILSEGLSLKGIVKDKDDGTPIAGARIYASVGTNDYGDIITETYSDSSGHYVLGGIQSDNGVTADALVHCTYYNKTITYVGSKINVHFTQKEQIQNFELSKAPFMLSSIWHYPVNITNLTQENGEYFVDGAIRGINGNEHFKPDIRDSLELNFTHLKLQVSGSGTSKTATPVDDHFYTDNMKFRTQLNSDFLAVAKADNPIFFSYQGGNNALHGIEIKRSEDGYSSVMGLASTSLEYFNFAYQYNGNFYLGESSQSPNIRIFSSNPSSDFPKIYNLMNLSYPFKKSIDMAFKIHEFPASALREKSFISGDTLYLYSDLAIDLPLSNPKIVHVHAGFIKITPKDILFNESGDSLTLNLEKWKLVCSTWNYQDNLGGLSANNVILKTQTVSLTLPQIIIHPHELIISKPGNTDQAGLSIGGITPLLLHTDAQFLFQYMETCPQDKKAHWMVKIFNPNGSNAAYLHNLPALNKDVEIQYVYNYSDGENSLKIPDNFQLQYDNIIDQTLNTISIYEDGFDLSGAMHFGIPGAMEGFTGVFNYYKNKQGQLAMRVRSLKTVVNTSGFVKFEGDNGFDNIALLPNSLKIHGTVFITDKSSTIPITLLSQLSKTSAETRMDIFSSKFEWLNNSGTDQFISLSGGNGRQRVLQGEALVANNDWNPLHYKVQFEQFGDALKSDSPSQMDFIVQGAIRNDTQKDNTINLSNIDTPFGQFKLDFDLVSSEIHGSLQMSNIPFGAVYIKEGTADMRMGGSGFYMSAHVDGLYPVIGQLTANFIVGTYPQLRPETKSLLLKNMHVHHLPGFLDSSGIHGLYLAANKTFVSYGGSFDFVIGSVGAYANLGLDAQFWLNFGDTYGGCHVGGMGYADLETYISVLVCDLCVGVNGELEAHTDYTWKPDNGFSVHACGSLGASADFCGYSFSKDFKLNIDWAVPQKFDVSLGLGKCSGNMKSQSVGCVHN